MFIIAVYVYHSASSGLWCPVHELSEFCLCSGGATSPKGKVARGVSEGMYSLNEGA